MPPPNDSSTNRLRATASFHHPLRLLFALLLAAVSLPRASTAPVPGSSLKYDQSQAGDYNVQVHLKNIEVYAILDDSSIGNEQYDYDYADMTLKPPPKPVEGATTVTFSPPSKVSGGTTVSEDSSTTTGQVAEAEATTNTVSSTSATSRTTRRCGAGFYRDHFGRCRRVRHPQLPLLSLSHLQRKNNGKTTASTLPSASSSSSLSLSSSSTIGGSEDEVIKTSTTPK